MLQNGTDWNKHHGIGATLLENWVEERAVADREAAKQDRQQLPEDKQLEHAKKAGLGGKEWKDLMKRGHNDILTHASDKHVMTTTFRDSYGAAKDLTHEPEPPTGAVKISHNVPVNLVGKQAEGGRGKRRMMMEAELLRRAIEEMETVPEDLSAKEWISTHHADYGHEDVYGKGKILGMNPPSQADVARFANPITFWSSQAVTGAGTTICSTPADVLRNLSSAARERNGQQHHHSHLQTGQRTSVPNNTTVDHNCRGGSQHCWCGGNDVKGHVCGVDGPDWVDEGSGSCGCASRSYAPEMGRAQQQGGRVGAQHKYETDNIPTPFGRGDVVVDGDGKDVTGKRG
ncbi:hypothetical protein HK097_011305, partial [Rhizophlyctis rosea]